MKILLGRIKRIGTLSFIHNSKAAISPIGLSQGLILPTLDDFDRYILIKDDANVACRVLETNS